MPVSAALMIRGGYGRRGWGAWGCGTSPRRLEPEHRHEPLLVLGVDARHDLDVLLQRRTAQLRPQPLVHLEDPGRVVHLDLDADGLVAAGRDLHRLDRV